MTVSRAGSAVGSVALPLVALTVLHASAFEAALVTASSQIASIPFAWWAGHLTVAHLVLAALVTSLANVVFDVGTATFLPSIVGRDELTSRNSLVSATESATQLGGPSIGGLVVQSLGAVTTLLVDVASFVVSAVLLRGLPRVSAPATGDEPGMGALIREGWWFVVRHPVMRPCLAGATAVNFANGALLALIPVFLVRDLLASPAVVGLLLAADGAGSLLGAALAPAVLARFGTARATIAAVGFAGVSTLVMPLGTGAWGMIAFATANVCFGTGVVVFSIAARTHRQLASPPELLSRVMATVKFVSWGAIPLGALAAGVLASAAGTRAALWTSCALTLVAPAVLWFSPVRRLRDLTDEPAPAR